MKNIALSLSSLLFKRTTVVTIATSGVVVAGLVGCSSILGFNDRPLLAAEGGLPDAALPPGEDTGAPTPGNDGGGGQGDTGVAPPDAAGDTGAVVVDAGTDAPTFENPLQIDVSALFNANTIVSTADGGIPLTPMDGSGTSDNNDFPTQSEMTALGQSLQYGLPDNAFFPASAPSTPNVQLWWNNASNLTENSLFAPSTLNQVFTFNVPPQPYLQVQLYATGAAGASTLNFTLSYADGSTSSSLTLPDWCDQSNPAGGEFFFAAVYRVENGNTAGATVLTTPVCRIYALNLNPDHGRTLQSVSFKDQVLSTNSTANLVFYGATAWSSL